MYNGLSKRILPGVQVQNLARGRVEIASAQLPANLDLSINGLSYSTTATSSISANLSWTSVGADVAMVGYRTSDGQWALKVTDGNTTAPWVVAPHLEQKYGSPVAYRHGGPRAGFEVFGLAALNVDINLYTDGLYNYQIFSGGSGTWTPPFTPILIDAVIMGGGGGGGLGAGVPSSNAGNCGGGGGSGKVTYVTNYPITTAISYSVGGNETASNLGPLSAAAGSRGTTGNAIGNFGLGGDGGSSGAAGLNGSGTTRQGGSFGNGGGASSASWAQSATFGQGTHIASGGGGGGGAYWAGQGGLGGFGPMGNGGAGGTCGNTGATQQGFQGTGFGSGSGGNTHSNSSSRPGLGGIILIRYPINSSIRDQ